jgi:hypothetical protein
MSAVSTVKSIQPIHTMGNIIRNDKNVNIEIFTICGAKIMSTNKSVIDITDLTHGVYMARVAGTREQIKIVR